ncbi:MAG: hypothetical protein WC313_08235 [Candidatus Kapaibacterium sp.]
MAFYDKLLKSKPDGYIGHLFDPPNDDGTLSMDQYTVGACYQKDMNGDIYYDINGVPVNCSEDEYCCKMSLWFTLDNFNVTSTFYFNLEDNRLPDSSIVVNNSSINCSTACARICHNVQFEPLMQVMCNPPCNTGDWSPEKNKKIPIPGCPECEVTVFFRTRTTDQCPEAGMQSFNDIYLDRIESIDDPSNPCYICEAPEQLIHTTVMNELVSTELTYPTGFNECKENYRIFQSGCWHDHYQHGIVEIDLPPKRMLIKCGDDNCCVHQYQLCRVGGEIQAPVLLDATATNVWCDYYTAPCFFVCEPPE